MLLLVKEKILLVICTPSIQWLLESSLTSLPSRTDCRNLNVFTQNKRSVRELHVGFEHPVLFVAVGAMLVGSIAWTVEEGQKVQKGEELGYFAYGGSTVIVLFPEEMGVEFDEDMSGWSKQAVEARIYAGQGVARCRSP